MSLKTKQEVQESIFNVQEDLLHVIRLLQEDGELELLEEFTKIYDYIDHLKQQNFHVFSIPKRIK